MELLGLLGFGLCLCQSSMCCSDRNVLRFVGLLVFGVEFLGMVVLRVVRDCVEVSF